MPKKGIFRVKTCS